MKYSIIIATYNRAKELVDTLQGLTRLKTASDWEVIVADNNSRDATRQVVESAQASFPAPLRYVFEGIQGKAAALNTAIREARGEIMKLIGRPLNVIVTPPTDFSFPALYTVRYVALNGIFEKTALINPLSSQTP